MGGWAGCWFEGAGVAEPVTNASKWYWATDESSVLRLCRARRRYGRRFLDELRCLSRRVAIGLNSFCPSVALLEAAFTVFSSADCRDISGCVDVAALRRCIRLEF